MMYQDNYFAVSVKLNFSQRQTHCIDDQNKFQSVTDTDNEITECQTPRKMLQSIGISPCQLTYIYENFKEQYSEAQKAQKYCLNNSESDSHEKDDKQEKVNPRV